jgi:hypothetical protein
MVLNRVNVRSWSNVPIPCHTMKTKKVTSWNELLADSRVEEVWTENNDGVDYWVMLKPPYEYDGCVCIHEWSKSKCISALNSLDK